MDAAVSALLFRGDPAHIANFVMSVNVDAVKAMGRGRSWSDLCKESGIAWKPKFNTSLAITPVAIIFRVVTPAFGGSVCSIFWRGFYLAAFIGASVNGTRLAY